MKSSLEEDYGRQSYGSDRAGTRYVGCVSCHRTMMVRSIRKHACDRMVSERQGLASAGGSIC